MKTLRDAKIGETVKVVKLHGEGAVKRRIMDMGLTKGVEMTSKRQLTEREEFRNEYQNCPCG